MAVINIVANVLSLSINSIRYPTLVGFSLADKLAKKDFADKHSSLFYAIISDEENKLYKFST
jgi:hypothetical protein